ncbi:MAG: hypothetical protein AUK44_04815 [Porphyromonadaceae bacterium CG2_30_38_12]|nr:MAG: hypothetical protein AUK44_04815 [Porphyromonadaceae bacterium CG2_30_38_12]
MKTNILKIAVLLITSFMVQACADDFLDVKLKNYQTSDNYFTTEASALAATNSCYDPIKGRGLFGENFQYFFYPADDRILFETPGQEQLLYTADNGNIGGNSINFALWDGIYRGVFRANMALEKIPPIQFKAANEPLKQRYLAEAKFLRGLYFFYAKILFDTPPVILKVLKDPSETVSNATSEQVWNQITTDLKSAAEVLPPSYDDANVGRATQGAANAMLGKAYLYQQKWDSAKIFLKKVIDSNVYELIKAKAETKEDYIAAYQCNFTPKDLKVGTRTYKAENNKESVFEIQNSDNTEMGYPNGEWSPGNGSDGSLLSAYFCGVTGYKNVCPTAEAAAIYEDGPATLSLTKDPRFYTGIFTTADTLSKNPNSKFYNKPWITGYAPATNQGVGLKKYYYPVHESVPAAPFFDPNNWRLIRYSDVLLMYAEACLQLNNDADGKGLAQLNEVRKRAGIPTIGTLSKEAIIHERDVELFGECLRYHDLVRWSMLPTPWVNPENMKYLQGYYKKGHNEYLPIPQSEIDAMQGNLKQNDYWK